MGCDDIGARETESAERNLERYKNADTVQYYAQATRVTACEMHLFETYLRHGIRILDVGVGAGRTTRVLADYACKYVGIDYASEMIEVAASSFPELTFKVMNAADLSEFGDGTFDAVVFSFNGIDYMHPAGKRHAFLQEARRVLAEKGILIFSTHNARVTFFPRNVWLDNVKGFDRLREWLHWLRWSLQRTLRRSMTQAFWNGEGYLWLADHSGLITHVALPTFVVSETTGFGFQWLETCPNFYPLATSRFTTGWYYYVFQKRA